MNICNAIKYIFDTVRSAPFVRICNPNGLNMSICNAIKYIFDTVRSAPFVRICNPNGLNMSICNAIKIFFGLKILIFSSVGLQIRLNGVIHPHGQWQVVSNHQTAFFQIPDGQWGNVKLQTSLLSCFYRQLRWEVTHLLTYSLLTFTFSHSHQPETLYLYIIYIIYNIYNI